MARLALSYILFILSLSQSAALKATVLDYLFYKIPEEPPWVIRDLLMDTLPRSSPSVVTAYPFRGIGNSNVAEISLVLLKSQYSMLGALLDLIVWDETDCSDFMAVYKILSSEDNIGFVTMLEQSSYFRGMLSRTLLRKSEYDVKFLLWLIKNSDVRGVFNGQPSQMEVLRFIFEQNQLIQSSLLLMLRNAPCVMHVIIENPSFIEVLQKLLTMKWPAELSEEQLSLSIAQAISNQPDISPHMLFYLLLGELQNNQLLEQPCYPEIHAQIVSLLADILPDSVDIAASASGLLALLTTHHHLYVEWIGHRVITNPGRAKATKLFIQLENAATTSLIQTFVHIILQWPSLIQPITVLLNSGIDVSLFLTANSAEQLIEILNPELPNTIIFATPTGSTIEQPMDKVLHREQPVELFMEWLARETVGIFTGFTNEDRNSLLSIVYQQDEGLQRELLTLGRRDSGLLATFLRNPQLLIWVEQVRRTPPIGPWGSRTSLSVVLEHMSYVTESFQRDGISPGRQRFMLSLLIRLFNGGGESFRDDVALNVSLIIVSKWITRWPQVLLDGSPLSCSSLPTPFLTLLINNPVYLQSMMNPIPVTVDINSSAVLQGLTLLNEAMTRNVQTKHLVQLMLFQPVLTHSLVSSISDQWATSSLLNFIETIPLEQIPTLIEAQIVGLRWMWQAETDTTIYSSVTAEAITFLMPALENLMRGLLAPDQLQRLAAHIVIRLNLRLNSVLSLGELKSLLRQKDV